MMAKFKHAWIRAQVQEPTESIKFYTRVPGMKEVGRSKIEIATGSFETLICLLGLTTGMMHEPLRFKAGRNWYSHRVERDFQTR